MWCREPATPLLAMPTFERTVTIPGVDERPSNADRPPVRTASSCRGFATNSGRTTKAAKPAFQMSVVSRIPLQ